MRSNPEIHRREPTIALTHTEDVNEFDGGELDFWLGTWDVSWGEHGGGTNRIARILGDHVIHEQFDGRGETARLVGESWSVFDPSGTSGGRRGSTIRAATSISSAGSSMAGSRSAARRPRTGQTPGNEWSSAT